MEGFLKELSRARTTTADTVYKQAFNILLAYTMEKYFIYTSFRTHFLDINFGVKLGTVSDNKIGCFLEGGVGGTARFRTREKNVPIVHIALQ